MSGTGWFAVMNIAIWIAATVGAILTNDSSVYVIPGAITILGGIGYVLIKG